MFRAKMDWDGVEEAIAEARLRVPSDWILDTIDFRGNEWYTFIHTPWVKTDGGQGRQCWGFTGYGKSPAEAVRNIKYKW